MRFLTAMQTPARAEYIAGGPRVAAAQHSVARRHGSVGQLPLIACLGVGLLLFTPVSAQDAGGFQEINAPVDAAKVRDVTRMSREGAVTDLESFRQVYNSRLAELTQKPKFSEAANIRKMLRRDLEQSGRAANQQFHSALNDLLLKTCGSLASQDRFHPVARLNFVLIIGDLNSREVQLGGSQDEVPLSEAQPVLLQFATNETAPDAVRVAALIGLLRHAQRNVLSGDARDQTVDAMQAMFTAPRPQQRPEEVHDWILTRAGEVLTSLNEQIPPRATDATPSDTPAVPGGNGPPALPPAG